MQAILVGREGEVDDIAALILGQSRAVLLEGDAGVGKSALLSALGRRFASSGRAASRVFGAAGARDLPLAPFSHLMKQWTPGDTPGSVVVELLLALEHRAQRDGMVLLVDDVQHLDDVSLTVLHQLISHSSVPVVLTRRADDPLPDLVDGLLTSGRLSSRVIQPLNRAASLELVASLAGAPPDLITGSRIWATTRGNPLFIRELVNEGVDTGRFVVADGYVSSVAAESRLDLRRTVMRRLGTLSADEVAALGLVSLFESIAVEPLRRRYGAALETLERRVLVRRQIRGRREAFVPAHPLYAEAARESLGADRPACWNEFIEMFEKQPLRRGDDVLQLAVASLRASRPPRIEQLLAGAGIAMARSAMDLVVELASAAQAIAPTTVGATLLGAAHFGRHEPELASAAFAAVVDAEANEADLTDMALAWATSLFFGAGDVAGTRQVLERFRPLISYPARHQLEVIDVVLECYTGHLDRSNEIVRRTHASGDASELARLWHTYPGSLSLILSGNVRAAARLLDWAAPIAPRHAASVIGATAQIQALGLVGSICNGDAATALPTIDESMAAAFEHRDAVLAGILIPTVALASWITGTIPPFIPDRSTTGAWHFGDGSWVAIERFALVAVHARWGSLQRADALRLADSAVAPMAVARSMQAAATAEVALANGARSMALNEFGRAVSLAAERGEHLIEWLLTMRMLGLRGSDRLLERAEQLVARIDGGLCDLVRPALAHLAADRFGAAVTCANDLERAGYRSLAGDVREAVAARCNNPAIIAAVTVEQSRPILLSDAESRVAEQVALGRSNKAIAADLTVSVKTVEFHVTAILRKYGVASRSELQHRMLSGPSSTSTV